MRPYVSVHGPYQRLGATRPLKNADPLIGAFVVAASAIAVFLIYSHLIDPSWRTLGAAGICFAAMLPAYQWCKGSVSGLPIFPLFAFTFMWTYAYPLATGHPLIMHYSEDSALSAALLVSGFLLVSTLSWQVALRSSPKTRGPIRTMASGKGDFFFSAILGVTSVLLLIVVGQWFEIPGGLFSIIRGALSGLSVVGLFVLSYRWGAGEMAGSKKAFFGAALLLYMIATSMTVFLNTAIISTILVISGYVIGRRRVPWKWAMIMFALFAVLHMGKGEMRQQYWYPTAAPVQLFEYPGFFAEWLGYGWAAMTDPREDDDSQPLYERLSLMHLLLKIQEESPHPVPYLNGETYAVVPQLLVPRALNPAKPNAHEGTTILSVHYGLQSRDDSWNTTIAWGLLNEAYANFGGVGVIVLGMVLGGLYGWATSLSIGVPILSLRMLIAILFAAFAVKGTEFTAGVYVSALFQSLVAVWGLSFLLMQVTQPRRLTT